MISIVSLHNIQFSANNVTVKLDDRTLLTNDFSKIQKALNLYDEIKNFIGKLEYDELLSGSIVAIRNDKDTEHDIETCLRKMLFDIQTLSNAIWFKYDSCVDTEVCFIFELGAKAKIANTMIKSGFYSSTGLKEILHIGYSDLSEIIENYYNKLNSATELVLGTTIVLNKDSERITRCLYHFSRARSSNVQELKIAEYCSGLESIFATSTSELAHILSERIAILLEGSLEKRMKIYNLIKKNYNIRSKVVHGASIKEKDMIDLSTKIDNISRKVICYVLENEEFQNLLEENNSEKINYYFLKKLFE